MEGGLLTSVTVIVRVTERGYIFPHFLLTPLPACPLLLRKRRGEDAVCYSFLLTMMRSCTLPLGFLVNNSARTVQRLSCVVQLHKKN